MPSIRSRSLLLIAGLMAGASWACSEASDITTASPDLRYAKGGATSGPVVSSANPAYGKQGETGKPVTITGSGFTAGAIVAWERNGTADPKITVHSAVVVSSTRIDAMISVAADADLAFYDISVTSLDRKKGVGTEMFEVSNATSIGTLGGNTQSNAANDNLAGPRVVGYSFSSTSQRAFYWPDANGSMADLGPGEATGISQDGNTIAGMTGGYAVIWSSSGGSWTRTTLPVSSGVIGSRADFMVSGADGAVAIIAGAEIVKAAKGNGKVHRPRLWRHNAGAWVLDTLELPPVTSGEANSIATGVNTSGLAVGSGGVWDSNGNWTRLPGADGVARAISEDGTIVAGFTSVAGYWSRVKNGDGSFGAWTGPFNLPGQCARAMAIDHNNRIVGHRCPIGGNRYVSAVWAAPYDAASMTTLSGLGNGTDAGSVWATSPGGTLLAGHAPSGTTRVGAIWDGGLF